MSRRTCRGVVLTEVLLALCLFVVVAVPLLTLVFSGRRHTEMNARHLQAIYICQRILEQVSLESAVNFDRLVSEPTPTPLISDGGARVSRYFRRLGASNVTVDQTMPGLAKHLVNFQVAVVFEPVGTKNTLKNVTVTVQYRLSPAHPKWHQVRLQTIVVRRSIL